MLRVTEKAGRPVLGFRLNINDSMNFRINPMTRATPTRIASHTRLGKWSN